MSTSWDPADNSVVFGNAGRTSAAAFSSKHEHYTHSQDMFWDGDLSTQTFITCKGLSSPQLSTESHRPSSAPARDRSNTYCLRKGDTPTYGRQGTRGPSYATDRYNDAYGSLVEQISSKVGNPALGYEDGNTGTRSVNGEHARDLSRTNIRLRYPALDDLLRRRHMTRSRGQDLERTATCQSVKEELEKRARRMQRTVKALQVYLQQRARRRAHPMRSCRDSHIFYDREHLMFW